MSLLSSPLRLFRTVAVAEAVTWGLLLAGMFLKYVTETTDVAVSIFGMAHGVVFIAYVLTTLVVWVDQRWSPVRGVLGLAAAVPPFLTVWFDRATEGRGLLDDRWRLADASATQAGPAEQAVAGLLRRPARAALGGVVAVAALTGVALAVGPPVG